MEKLRKGAYFKDLQEVTTESEIRKLAGSTNEGMAEFCLENIETHLTVN